MAERPSEAPVPANRGSVADKYKYRKALCRTFQSTGNCHYGDTCPFSHNTCKFNFKSRCPYGSSSSAPVLASESGNAQTAPKTLVNAEVQNPLKLTGSKHEMSPREVSTFKWKRSKKYVGIYADWIDEESSVPGSASGSQQ
uniref:C3H1-type domain-containing protein n=1 Tax=Chenopodium quinoa TaxID=63459 RepID=A0A803LN47_CHEQI